jgi:hypothetical protein
MLVGTLSQELGSRIPFHIERKEWSWELVDQSVGVNLSWRFPLEGTTSFLDEIE